MVSAGSRQYPRSQMASDLNDGATAFALLTPREIQVLERTATGRTNADVAAELGVTIHAIKFHLASIFRKLGVQNRTEATARYLASSSNVGVGTVQ